MTELSRDDSELAAILVVDECDLESRARLWNLLKAQSPRIKLISIYNDLDEPSGTTVVLDLPLLDTAQVRAIIEDTVCRRTTPRGGRSFATDRRASPM